MSKTIQNDLISAIATTIKNEINQEIDAAPFFSWQIDETTDVRCHSQLSVIVCYVDDQGAIQERFFLTNVRSNWKRGDAAVSEFV